MDSTMLPALLLVLLFVGAISLEEVARRLSRRWRRASIGSARCAEATIASDLAPKIRTLQADPDFNPLTLYVVGGDGFPVWTAATYPWKGFLEELLDRGATIQYVFSNASPATEAMLSTLRRELQMHSKGTISFYFFRSDVADETDKALIASLKTFHPTLIEGRGKRAMWIEGYHPENTTVAYSCEFVSPNDAATDPRYERYKEAITHLIVTYGQEVAVAAAA